MRTRHQKKKSRVKPRMVMRGQTSKRKTVTWEMRMSPLSTVTKMQRPLKWRESRLRRRRQKKRNTKHLT
jgi:hypothetical protein